MRALHLVKTSVGATWALRQMRELRALGVDVHVGLPLGGPLIEEYDRAGIVTHDLDCNFPVGTPWRLPGVIRGLRRVVGSVRPDIVHSHFVGTTLSMRLALGRRHPTPRLFQVPGPLHLEHRLFGTAEIGIAGPPDYWIGSCELTCKLYRSNGVSDERVFLSYYGVDLGAWEGHARGRLRAELEIDGQRPLIGMVAYMYAPKWYLGQSRGIKGHEDFIDAAAKCMRDMPDLTAVIIGGPWGEAGHYERRLRAYAERRCGDRLVFLGTRTDVAALYPDLDVAIHPSHSENVGGAVESLLSGVPTITSNVGGFTDLIRHRRTGWLVAPKAPDALAATILEVLAERDLAAHTARQGRDLARVSFDVRRTAGEIKGIYEQVLEKTA